MSQHTVIIGGTAGIGLAAARTLAAERHLVTVVGRDPQRLKERDVRGEAGEHLGPLLGRPHAGRPGRPEEIADVIAMLVRNTYLTGTVIPVDGGLRLKP